MGAYINLTNHINIAKESRTNGCIKTLGYKDIDDRMIKEIVNDRKIKWIQIEEFLTDEAYQIIDKILSLRTDIVFRFFHFFDDDKIDISFLLKMPHLTRLRFDCIDFRDNQQRINFDVLTKLRLKSFHIECFDLRDYEFIKYLSPDLEELVIMADTMGPGIKFDCSWLLKYRHLNSLWLGKKAKKNLEVDDEDDIYKDLTSGKANTSKKTGSGKSGREPVSDEIILTIVLFVSAEIVRWHSSTTKAMHIP